MDAFEIGQCSIGSVRFQLLFVQEPDEADGDSSLHCDDLRIEVASSKANAEWNYGSELNALVFVSFWPCILFQPGALLRKPTESPTQNPSRFQARHRRIIGRVILGHG